MCVRVPPVPESGAVIDATRAVTAFADGTPARPAPTTRAAATATAAAAAARVLQRRRTHDDVVAMSTTPQAAPSQALRLNVRASPMRSRSSTSTLTTRANVVRAPATSPTASGTSIARKAPRALALPRVDVARYSPPKAVADSPPPAAPLE